jgi:hypothetical protein
MIDQQIAKLTVAQARSRNLVRLLVPFIVFGLALAAVLGVRMIVAGRQTTAVATAGKTVPTNPTIENTWGVRFTAVNVLADGGIVELRYSVLDPAKGSRMHSGDITNLPIIHADGSGKEVRSNSLMFHIHTDHMGEDVEGRNYSIVYGNADGAVRSGETVTIILADGLRLEHVPVS